MADTKISDETTAGTLTGAELIPAVQSGSNVKLTPSSIVNDLAILTYDSVDNTIDYPPGTTILDLDTIGGAPVDAEYIVATSHAGLSAERVLTDSTTITKNVATTGQVAFERAALTGDITAPANSNATTLANDVVTNAKLANMAANTVKVNNTASSADPTDLALSSSQLLGRGSTGDIAPITLGAGLTMTGTELSNSASATGSNATAYKFRFSTATEQVDPGASYVRLDSAIQSSATNFAISVTDADANNMTNVIAFLKKNYRVMFKSVDPARSSFLELRVISIELIDTTHYLINYTRMASKAFINDEYIWMTFSSYSGIYLDEDDDRIKRWSDNAIIDGPLVIPDIATALTSPDLDTTISTKHGMTAMVEDPGGNASNTLIETFPWPIMVNFTKNRLEQVGGQCLLAKLSKPVRVTVPTDGLTWTVADVAGKVKLTAASHGLPALEANTFTYLVAKAGTGWPVGSLHLITAISGNDVSLDTDFDNQGNPDFYAVTEQFTAFSVTIPPLREWSEVFGRVDVRMSDSANDKVIIMDLDNSFVIWDPVNNGTTPDVFDNFAGVNRNFAFYNIGSKSVQNANVAKTNNSGIGGTIASAFTLVGAEDTTTAKVLRLKVTLATVGEFIELNAATVSVIW